METDAVLNDGLVFLSANEQAAATWLPPGAKESVGLLTVLRNLPTWALAASLVHGFQALRAFALTERLRPKQPHYYLASVGAHPDFQGLGLGSSLLDAMMPRIDAEGLPSYLLSSNARNLPLYESYGYRVLEELPLPHGGPLRLRLPAREHRQYRRLPLRQRGTLHHQPVHHHRRRGLLAPFLQPPTSLPPLRIERLKFRRSCFASDAACLSTLVNS